MAHEPPATVKVRFCPACGRDDRGWSLESEHGTGVERRTPCPGTVQTLIYELRAEPQRTRAEMIKAAAEGCRKLYKQPANSIEGAAEAVLIATGVIEEAPDA